MIVIFFFSFCRIYPFSYKNSLCRCDWFSFLVQLSIASLFVSLSNMVHVLLGWVTIIAVELV